jgi:hypothetical protein
MKTRENGRHTRIERKAVYNRKLQQNTSKGYCGALKPQQNQYMQICKRTQSSQ